MLANKGIIVRVAFHICERPHCQLTAISLQDFEGQKIADRNLQILLSLSGVVAFFIGLFLQDLKATLLILGAGVIITGLGIIPPWPRYNQKPVAWLSKRSVAKVGSDDEDEDGEEEEAAESQSLLARIGRILF
ncbi:hypothetical protein HK097_008872 [Rhizophlyctis rosea]|uniref:Signal peptidase complex subunit 1 n=1 Tax=Rhizophlyctis rosea TaxID=64517 RepID=A0AAD5SIV0_9FUNG|nr:hypothetical protein HK097_008872 [Rhizophlyctis rosea]